MISKCQGLAKEYTQDKFGNYDKAKGAKVIMCAFLSSLVLSVGGDLLNNNSLALNTSKDGGFYETEFLSLIYPPAFLQVEEIEVDGMIVMTSLTENKAEIGSIPRIDSMLVSPTGFANPLTAEMSAKEKEDMFLEFASIVIASYYGETGIEYGSVIKMAGLPMKVDEMTVSFEETMFEATLLATVDPYKDLPKMTYTLVLEGTDQLGLVSCLAFHQEISDDAELIFTRVFESIALTEPPEEEQP